MDLKGFGCQGDPFAEAPDRRYVYFDDLQRRVLEEIINSIGRTSGWIVLIGEAGAGKTTMLQCLFEEIEKRAECYLLSSMPWLTCRQGTTLRELAQVFSYARCVARSGDARLEEHLAAGLAAGDRVDLGRGPGGRRLAGVILDDAHRLAPQVVMQFRRWRTAFQSVRGPLSVILTATSDEGAAEAGGIEDFLAGAGSRDVVTRLRRFNRNDVEQLIDRRLQAAGYAGPMLFPPEAVTRIFGHAEGNPSRTMRLCRQAVALAANDCGPVTVAEIDAAAQIELLPQPNLKRNAISCRTFGISLAKVSARPPTPAMPPHVRRDGLGKEFAANEPSVRSSFAFRERKALRRRLLNFTSAAASMVAVLAVGWFYVAERDAAVHPTGASEGTVSAGVTAAIARVQPGEDQRAADLPGEVARPVDASVSAASKVSPREVETPRLRDLNQVAPAGVDPEPPEAKAKAAPAVEELLDSGNRLLELGDVAAARLFYGLAAERGSAEGALLMGLTFDPAYFERKGVQGTRPHVLKAADWYQKAVALGSSAAEEYQSALELRLRSAVQDGDEDARPALFDPPPR